MDLRHPLDFVGPRTFATLGLGGVTLAMLGVLLPLPLVAVGLFFVRRVPLEWVLFALTVLAVADRLGL